MKKTKIIKIITLFLMISLLVSAFALPTFATDGGDSSQAPAPWWEQLAEAVLFIVLSIVIIILTPIVIIIGGTLGLLCLLLVELLKIAGEGISIVGDIINNLLT